MKNQILFSVIGAIILFIWQFISNAMPNFHRSAQEFTPLQDTLLCVIEKSGLQEGMYLLGKQNPNDNCNDETPYATLTDWAILNYQVDESQDMLVPMLRSFINSLLISFILFFILKKFNPSTVWTKIMVSVGVGMIGFFYIAYSNFIWYKTPDVWAYFADAIVPYVFLAMLAQAVLPREDEVYEEILSLEEEDED